MAKWEQLIAARERKHLSQVEVAERLNVGVVTYQRWEAGNARPQPQHMRNLCEVFETLLHQYGETPAQETGTCSSTFVPTTEGSRDTTSVGVLAEDLDTPQAFIATHLTTCLWSLAFLDHANSHQKRSAIRQAIKDFDHMNSTNKNYQISRREACLLQYTQRPDVRPFNPRIRGKLYSALALMQAKNGLSPDTSLGKVAEIDLGDENNGFVDFKQSMLFLETGWTYCYQGSQTKAMEWLEKRVDPKTLEPKITQSGLGRIETINAMTLSSLKAKNRDMEQTIHFWTSGMQGAITLQSEQRFNEALSNYELMEVVWPDEQRIADLRDQIVHWEA